MTRPATWNVYMVMEDGESRIFAAPSMARAVESAWQQNLAELVEDRQGEPFNEQEAYDARREWEDSVLESCTLVGELENVDDLIQRAANSKEPNPS